MNSGQRIAIVLVAVVVLVGGFFLARGSGDDESSSSVDVTTTSTGTGGAQAPDTTTPAETEAPTETTEQAPPPRVEAIRIRDGRPASGKARTIKYDSGETVRLSFSSNTAAEIHIHGYDKSLGVPAGGSARISFKANAEGIFEIEEHHTDAVLANLEVRP